MHRLVKAELLFQRLDEFRVQPLRALVFDGGIRLPTATDSLPPASLPELPLIRAVASVSVPCIFAMTCSMGPPGTN